ncbi:MAG: bifunctional transcriptional activator/DNA repair enzyme AdaA [Lewinella sp.]
MLITDTETIKKYYRALLARDAEFLGVYFVGVKTTSVFCLPTCRARKPLFKNVVFYSTFEETEAAGFRPCKVCRPGAPSDWTPEYITQTLNLLEPFPEEKISDALLRQHGISPASVRRWFLQRHGMTFHAFQRTQRMLMAKEAIRQGKQVTEVAFNSGYESLSGFGTAFKNVIGESPEESKR